MKNQYAVLQVNSFFKQPRIASLWDTFEEAQEEADNENSLSNMEHFVYFQDCGFSDSEAGKTTDLGDGDKLYHSDQQDSPVLCVLELDTLNSEAFEREYKFAADEDDFGSFDLVSYLHDESECEDVDE